MTKKSYNKSNFTFDRKLEEAQHYLEANGFDRSTKTLVQDMERCERKYILKE